MRNRSQSSVRPAEVHASTVHPGEEPAQEWRRLPRGPTFAPSPGGTVPNVPKRSSLKGRSQ
eukprot:CAMPEP_0195099510 /NCGR_PEP_ID=MMETSP0448-20130528/58324_1 /TAXON_ID=66468 /ORGANISM="Heterocapsa triquestra, Strain CCMP 448" /LENGTH=60 /DNA_ID=CAMNT_0040134403 /DNA_START=159 /DNA_END=338 /DNA_ORIENTATION=-